MAFVFAIISTAYVMILPFIKLYTASVTEINYSDPFLPLLFALIQLLSCCRITNANLVKIAGHAAKTVPRTIAEALINIIVSVIGVYYLGIYGVLVGTICALLYRTNDFLIYGNKVILKRSAWKTYRTVLVNFVIFLSVVLATKYFGVLNIENYAKFFAYAAVTCAVMFVVYFSATLIIDRQSVLLVWRNVCRRRGQGHSRGVI